MSPAERSVRLQNTSGLCRSKSKPWWRRYLRKIATHGLQARGVSFRHIEGKLWEVRAGTHRIFYVLLQHDEMVLLHAYRKHTRKAPRRHIEIARRRMKEVLG